MPPIPRETGLDHSRAFLREGYDFIGNRCARFHSDIFATRLMLRRAVCLRGAEAAEIFYGGERFTRKGAMPLPTVKLLQDFGSVQMLDGAAHRERKRMFLSVTGPQQAARLADLMAQEWRRQLGRWQATQRVVLFDESRAILTRAALTFAGIPFDEAEAAQRCRELSAMVEGAGAIGPRNWRGHRFARGDWVLLDLYGTNHDPRRWPEPHAFRPERLIEHPPSRYDVVPQGGGEVASGHRCPGEGLTVALTQTALRLLAIGMRYDLPAQDLSVDLARIPALPKSGFVIGNIRPAADAA